MIIGLGSDIVDIRRIEESLARFGERFIARIYTPIERAKAEGRAGRAATYAKRFAAKEACAKALGTGFRRGVFWRDLGVVNLAGGKPSMALTGGAAARLAALTPPGLVSLIELTMTDEYPYAQAMVILQAVPPPAAAPAPAQGRAP
ncbi:MAG: holo-ACP synthase [Alphaproteobacteria bacterium]|nr:holo-ACP synthase [Alphaproteobacteria bacterium]